MSDSFKDQFHAGNYGAILASNLVKRLLQPTAISSNSTPRESVTWIETVTENIRDIFKTDKNTEIDDLFYIGQAAFYSFLQTNVTGPPLDFSPDQLLLGNTKDPKSEQKRLIAALSIDGESAYQLTPGIELFYLARIVFSSNLIPKSPKWRLFTLRILFWHQKLLSDSSATLKTGVFEELGLLETEIFGPTSNHSNNEKASLLLEKAAIETFYGLDAKAKLSIKKAAEVRGFEFVITGRLGKRTKFQEKDVSQLLVLAKSAQNAEESDQKSSNWKVAQPDSSNTSDINLLRPENIDLNDDTLLESISFTKREDTNDPVFKVEENIPAPLAALDPASQPVLHPLDAIVLLSVASSVTNTSPADGLTREETLPYATRVLDSGSVNWQIYSQALLVRSRIEGYKSRTIERGVLQLQALVDQVIAETTSKDLTVTSFLPRPKESESAPVQERLKYVFQLDSSTRWDLEAQLAARWVSLGGLRTALEIYERLEMWAEVALCWAATEKEDKAEKIVRRMLFHRTNGSAAQNGEAENGEVDESETWKGEEQNPLPEAAPRLFCILADFTNDIKYYERAWEVSNGHYTRAQRSLGRHYFASRKYESAATAYAKSLKIKPLDQGTWFALGCARLELREWDEAAASFVRCVQIDDGDAEAWTNLASALLKKGTLTPAATSHDGHLSNRDRANRDALNALKRAAALKRDDFRIWSNLMIVATSVVPPDFAALIQGQAEIIKLRGEVDGERCIDAEIVEKLVQYVIAIGSDDPDDDTPRPRPGLERVVVQLVEQKVIPLITSNAQLWRVVFRMYIWLRRQDLALDAQEKGWRAVTSVPGWETGTAEQWTAVVDATIDLVDLYESLGIDGWKFKARSAIRSINGRGKESWEGTEGWTRLKDRLAELR